MKSLHKRQIILINKLLLEDKPITSKQLAFFVGVSVRTIKSDIVEINEKVENYHIHIMSKPREGYWIVIDKDADIAELSEVTDNKVIKRFDDTPKFNYERINYIIKKLLVVDYHIKLEDLMDEIFISRSTLTQDLKEVKNLLSKFRLKVISRSNYGIIIEGSEFDKRLCIAEYFFHYNNSANYSIASENMFTFGKSKKEYDTILKFIKEVCDKYNIILSDFSLNNFTIHIFISLRRCTFYNYIKAENDLKENVKDSVEFKAATELTKKLEDYFEFMLPLGETIYYSLHLKSKRISNEDQINSQEKERLKQCIVTIIEEVNSNFNINLESDKELYDYLYLHIAQMIIRLKNNMSIRNPLAHDNLRRYLFATKITYTACMIIEKYYDIKIDINEFGYLVLYFNLALCKINSKKKIRIGFLSGRGRPESTMYLNEITENFSQEKYEIRVLDKDQITNGDYKDTDLLVSTYTFKVPSNVTSITIENDCYIDKIRKAVNEIQVNNLNFEKYFKEEYSCFNLEGSTKEDVLENLYEKFIQLKFIDKLPDKDDNFAYNEIGNGIVHFQDLYRICRNGFFFIAVLNKPVLWDQDVIRVLIMLKTKRDGDKDLSTLCKIISKWSNNPEMVEDIIGHMDYSLFLNDIKNI
ncbi:BglG family transcription antiterminator [Clostridium algidicarnis]|uniref:BglG family transcription antiterminator n=1 Tax=Clostridium algidicarnis TaxID=37659 RepID=UPI001628173D|nr:transcription antiterminator [Clostridium algidicarnis]MBB6696518.1 BglG family transcription antiterminator [Clostridium algidicarnis]MBU3205845.1 transcription antiterminator [Clostridium algidicarnis]